MPQKWQPAADFASAQSIHSALSSGAVAPVLLYSQLEKFLSIKPRLTTTCKMFESPAKYEVTR
jgi:hypothetical protein